MNSEDRNFKFVLELLEYNSKLVKFVQNEFKNRRKSIPDIQYVCDEICRIENDFKNFNKIEDKSDQDLVLFKNLSDEESVDSDSSQETKMDSDIKELAENKEVNEQNLVPPKPLVIKVDDEMVSRKDFEEVLKQNIFLKDQFKEFFEVHGCNLRQYLDLTIYKNKLEVKENQILKLKSYLFSILKHDKRDKILEKLMQNKNEIEKKKKNPRKR